MFGTSKICSIQPSITKSWSKRIFITFDLDWAHDEVISDTINLIAESGVSSTWFITHESPVLDKLRKLKDTELGIHPNFYSTSQGIQNEEERIDELLGIVPEAKSVRSHCLFHSERLVDIFYKKGLTHISNSFIPHSSGMKSQPFSIWDSMIMVPHCWQDNVSFKMNLPFPQKSDLLESFHVFNFHPIHIFLNTENISRYELSRPYHQTPERLIEKRFSGSGTRTLLIKLLDILKTEAEYLRSESIQ